MLGGIVLGIFVALLFAGCDESVNVPCTHLYGSILENDSQYREYFTGSWEYIGVISLDEADNIDFDELEEMYRKEKEEQYSNLGSSQRTFYYITSDEILSLEYFKYFKNPAVGDISFFGSESEYHFHTWKNDLLVEWGNSLLRYPMSVGKMTENYFLWCAASMSERGLYNVYKRVESLNPILETHKKILKTLDANTWQLTEKRIYNCTESVSQIDKYTTYENIYVNCSCSDNKYPASSFYVKVSEKQHDTGEMKPVCGFESRIAYSDVYDADVYVQGRLEDSQEKIYLKISQFEDNGFSVSYEEQADGIKRVTEYTFKLVP